MDAGKTTFSLLYPVFLAAFFSVNNHSFLLLMQAQSVQMQPCPGGRDCAQSIGSAKKKLIDQTTRMDEDEWHDDGNMAAQRMSIAR